MKLWKRAWAVLVSAVLLCSVLVLPAAAAGTQRMTKYKTVFVHGMLGWGSYGYLSNMVDYWGSGTGSILDDLTRQGYDVYGASVGPISSSWDRACELYAQITGTRRTSSTWSGTASAARPFAGCSTFLPMAAPKKWQPVRRTVRRCHRCSRAAKAGMWLL